MTEIETAVKAEGDRLRAMMRKLMGIQHLNFDRIAYDIKENEGEGWEGPNVKAFIEVTTDIAEELATHPSG